MNQRDHEQSIQTLSLIIGVVLVLAHPLSTALAQVPPITPSGLNTQVSAPAPLPNGQTIMNITGGTRPGNGPNLFHSFGEFGVPSNNIANFLNDSGLATSNILGRVTGGNISNIFGTIQTTDFGNANLFLINPAGFLFGPNATVNVGGMVAFTSADYLRLTDGAKFKAVPTAAADALLSAAPVAAFGFLGSNPGAITVQGSQLSVANGKGISLVGDNITIQSGTLDNGTVQSARLSAPGGQINLVSVGQPQNPTRGGEISATDFSPSSTRGFSSMGTIALSNGANVTASGDGVSATNGGTVLIRGGQLMVSNSSIRADGMALSPTGGDGGRIEVHAGAVTLDQATMSATGDLSNGGQIRIMDLVTLSSTQSNLVVNTRPRNGEGNGGSISVGSPTTESIALTATLMDSTQGLFVGKTPGDITLTARSLNIDGGTLNVQSQHVVSGGAITLNADRVAITNGASLLSGNADNGQGGTVTIQGLQSTGEKPTPATTVVIDGSGIALRSNGPTGDNGNIVVHAKAVTLSNSDLFVETIGSIGIGTISLADVGTLTSISSSFTTRNSGLAGNGSIILGSSTTSVINLQDTSVRTLHMPDGNINLTASRLNISGGSITTGFLADSGGHITANAGTLTLTNGAQVSTSAGGDISFTAQNLSLTGGSTVTANSTGAGNAGTIQLKAGDNLTVNDSVVSANSTEAGNAGTIQLKAGDNLYVNESAVTANSTGGGNAGTIQLKAGDNLYVNESAVTANSTGAGNAGTIQLKAGNDILLNKSVVSAQSEGTGNVGSIQLKAGDRIILRDSVVTPAPTIVSE